MVLYNRALFPPSWEHVARASSHQRLSLRAAVKQQNLGELEERFWAVSDPKSPFWRSFMTKEEIGELVQSKKEDMKVVVDWLKQGLSPDAELKQGYDAVEVELSVGDAEKLFETTLHIFVDSTGFMIVRTLGEHSVPAEVAQAIDFVEGLADFPMQRPSVKKVPGEATSGPVTMVCPQTLLGIYSVPAVTTPLNTSQCPAEFQGYPPYDKPSMKVFFQDMNLPDEPIQHIVGPFLGGGGVESSLDIQYIMGVGYVRENWYWTTNNWLYTFANSVFAADKVPDSISMSYAWAEDSTCSGLMPQGCSTLGVDSAGYVARVNTEFQKIGLRGVSLFAASGDSGANGRSDEECTDSVLHADFPAASPYVTSVGATMLQNPVFELNPLPPACTQVPNSQCASGGVEVAVSFPGAGFTSGGGFSTFSPMPAYQQEVVGGYLNSSASKLPPASFFKRTNRAHPDMAAMGSNFMVRIGDTWELVGGTSAATPTAAGVAAFLNDLSYRKSGKPLGFLNPLLYQMHKEMPEAFTDITVGDNKCTESGCAAGCQGFEAAPGWDPVSGLGSPVASKMLAYLSELLDRSSQSLVV